MSENGLTLYPADLRNIIAQGEEVSLSISVTISMPDPDGNAESAQVMLTCAKALAEKKFSDLTVQCKNQEFQAHSLILKCENITSSIKSLPPYF